MILYLCSTDESWLKRAYSWTMIMIWWSNMANIAKFTCKPMWLHEPKQFPKSYLSLKVLFCFVFFFDEFVTFTAKVFNKLQHLGHIIGCIWIVEKLFGTFLQCREWCNVLIRMLTLRWSQLTDSIATLKLWYFSVKRSNNALSNQNIPFAELFTLALQTAKLGFEFCLLNYRFG